MTEQEKLKEICDLIGHEPMYGYKNLKGFYQIMSKSGLYRKVNVREIIFTPEFMDKYWEYYKLNKFSSDSIWKTMQLEMFNNLDNPVDYLYDLLRLGKN